MPSTYIFPNPLYKVVNTIFNKESVDVKFLRHQKKPVQVLEDEISVLVTSSRECT